VIGDLFRAVEQLRDPRVLKYLLATVAISVLCVGVLWAGFGWLLTETTLFRTGWLEWVVDILGGVAVAVLTILFFPLVVTTVLGEFMEAIAAAVEARYYPHLPPGADPTVLGGLVTAARFLGVTLAANILVLGALLVPPLFPFVFYGVNGYLLGREYYELVASRRLPRGEADALRRRHGGTVVVTGIVITLLLTLPGINLIAPVIAAALMVHRFHRLRGERPRRARTA